MTLSLVRHPLTCALAFAFVLRSTPAQTPPQSESQPAITIQSPQQYQVFQRSSRLSGTIVVRGIAPAANQVDVRFVGISLTGPLSGNWTQVHFSTQTHAFDEAFRVTPGGFYTVDIRATDSSGHTTSQSIPKVGVGEVFVISGQSNSTNYGEARQHTETGMVTGFDGTRWVLANDPQPGVQDNSTKGSFIPALGDALYRKYHVPIGIASVGHGSTSVRQWLPAGTPIGVMPTMTRYVTALPNGDLVSDGVLFDGMMTRIHQLGHNGFRALLWHQGESDCHQPPAHEISADTYAGMMRQLIRASRQSAGWPFPWIIAVASYHTPDDLGCPAIREAQQKLAADGLAFQGPNTDILTTAYRQNGGTGTHFNDAGLKAHGLLWADVVSRYLDTVLEPPATREAQPGRP